MPCRQGTDKRQQVKRVRREFLEQVSHDRNLLCVPVGVQPNVTIGFPPGFMRIGGSMSRDGHLRLVAGSLCFEQNKFPVILKVLKSRRSGNLNRLQRKRNPVADTTKVEDKLERKKLKRTARKKAAPKAKRTGPRGEKKKKVKKLARGQSKR